MSEKSSGKKQELLSNEFLSRFLNYSGAIIILIVVFSFLIPAIYKSSIPTNTSIDTIYHVKEVKFKYTTDLKSDTAKTITVVELLDEIKNSNDSLNKKILNLNKIKAEIELTNNANKEDLRFYLTILGAIFAIVGFFGFKSIHDTRQAAIEKAVIDAKNEATAVAKKEVGNKLEALQEITRMTIEQARSETKLQLQSDFYGQKMELEALKGDLKEATNRLNKVDSIDSQLEDIKIRIQELEHSLVNRNDTE